MTFHTLVVWCKSALYSFVTPWRFEVLMIFLTVLFYSNDKVTSYVKNVTVTVTSNFRNVSLTF